MCLPPLVGEWGVTRAPHNAVADKGNVPIPPPKLFIGQFSWHKPNLPYLENKTPQLLGQLLKNARVFGDIFFLDFFADKIGPVFLCEGPMMVQNGTIFHHTKNHL